jgi:hypothetical protein
MFGARTKILLCHIYSMEQGPLNHCFTIAEGIESISYIGASMGQILSPKTTELVMKVGGWYSLHYLSYSFGKSIRKILC